VEWGFDLATIPPLRVPRKKRAECSGRDDGFLVVDGLGAKTQGSKKQQVPPLRSG